MQFYLLERKIKVNKDNFVSELSKLNSKSMFLTLLGYRNAFSEIADYNIVFHISYKKAILKSISILESLNLVSYLENKAKSELLDGYYSSLNEMKSSDEILSNNYTWFFDTDGNYIKGVKLHTETNTLHIYGFVNAKRVIMPGNYPHRNKQELTIAKDKLRKFCPVSKFRQFKITESQVDKISVENLSLLPPI